MRITFFVPGIPQPGGSKRGFVVNGKAVITEDAKKSKPWRVSVQGAAREAYQGPPLDAPLALFVTFQMPRPRGHYGTRGQLRASARPFPTVKPDATKLVRSLEDALTGIIWRDDTLIVSQHIDKIYHETPGAIVMIDVLPGAA